MQEKISNNAILFITRLKSVLKISTDLQLAAYLGINQSTLSSWKSRNSIDYDKIIEKCNNISLDYLVYGTQTIDNNSQNAIINTSITESDQCENCKTRQQRIKDLEQIISLQSDLIQELKEKKTHAQGDAGCAAAG